MHIFEEFRRHRREHPDLSAFLITSGDRSLPITWRQFTDDIAAVSWLITKHVPGAVIGLIGENSYEWIAVHAACMFSGATVIPLDPNLTTDEIVERLRFVGARVLVHSSLYAKRAREVAARLPGLMTGGFGTRKTDLYLEAARKALALGVKSVFDGEGPDRERTSMIVFTSGTTSKPRGAELNLDGVEAFCENAAVRLEFRAGQRSLMLLPLHHIFGIATAYLMLANGVAMGVCPDFRRIYDAVERFRANFLFLVPALAEILAAKIEQHGRSAEEALGSPIDWILTGGAPLPRRTYEHLTMLGVKMLTGYGLTETTALYSIAPEFGDPHVGSAGQAVAMNGVETAVSPAGELLIRGRGVMRGYFRDAEHTAKAIDADGWYHTGDLGRIDSDGFVWIEGRASRTIILSSGKKVAPEELEEKLLAIPGILEAVVSGNGATREICAEVYGTVGEDSIRKAIGRLNLLLPVYKRISGIVVRSEPFPRTSSGKIRIGTEGR